MQTAHRVSTWRKAAPVALILAVAGLLPTSLFAQADDSIWRQQMEAASAAIKAGDPEEVMFALGNALNEAEDFSPGDQRLANTISLLAAFHRSQGELEQAEELYRRLVTVLEKGSGPESPSVANALDTLAELHQEESRILKEVAEEQQAPHQEGEAQEAGNAHAPAVQSGAHAHDEHLEAATKLLQRSLAIREKALGMNDPSVDASVNRLAAVYDEQGHFDQAEPLLRRSVQTRERVFGKDAPEISSSLHNLGILKQKQNKLPEAIELLKRAWQVREKKFGLKDLEMERSITALGTIYMHQKKYKDADVLFQLSLKVRENLVGTDHMSLVPSLGNLATLYAMQDRPAEAQKLLVRSLAIEEKTFGGEETSYLIPTLNNLALAHMAQKHYAQAATIWERVLKIQETENGIFHASLLPTLAALYDAHDKAGNKEGAIRAGRRQENVAEMSGQHEH